MKENIRLQDIFDDRDRISGGFFHYTFWIMGIIMSAGVAIILSFMKEYYLVTPEMVQIGFSCIGAGLGIVIYRLYFIMRDDISKEKRGGYSQIINVKTNRSINK